MPATNFSKNIKAQLSLPAGVGQTVIAAYQVPPNRGKGFITGQAKFTLTGAPVVTVGYRPIRVMTSEPKAEALTTITEYEDLIASGGSALADATADIYNFGVGDVAFSAITVVATGYYGLVFDFNSFPPEGILMTFTNGAAAGNSALIDLELMFD